MTEFGIKFTDFGKNLGNKILNIVQEYTLDRFVWCLAAIGFCLCEVQDYHQLIFVKQAYIMTFLCLFYCVKLGCFAKGKRIFCAVATAIGAAVTVYMMQSNYFVGYSYLNLSIGLLATVLLNLFVLVIYNAIKDRRFPVSISPSLTLIFLIVAMQLSVFDYRRYYLYILIVLLPLVLMKKGYRTRSCVLNGILDGMCIGFFVVQGYAWMHRPYNYVAIRYTGITNACTTMSRIYIAYFAAWIIRYVQASRLKLNFFNGISRVFCWIMAAFVLALEYLTGSRSAVMAMMLITAIAVAVRYIGHKVSWRKCLGRVLLWGINCVCVGLVSLALFPLAYATVRYLPAYVNNPDFVDATGYRMYSFPIRQGVENFGWDYEYDVYSIKKDDAIDNPKYVSYAEATWYNLGRIIPKADVYLEDVLSEDLLVNGIKRAEYYYEQEVYSKEEYDRQIRALHIAYGSDADSTSEEMAAEGGSIAKVYKLLMEKLLSTLVLHADAAKFAEEAVLTSDTAIVAEGDVSTGGFMTGRGDSAENPWYSDEEFPGNGMALRVAIHEYAISKLNMEGHASGSFSMWVTSTNEQPHAHNIFLVMGYDYGIPSMVLMILMFVVTFIAGLYNTVRYGKTEYLLPVLLVAGMTVFGWFEKGFDYKTGILVWIYLCVIFTDVLKVKKVKGRS